jgi:hypothetical protein
MPTPDATLKVIPLDAAKELARVLSYQSAAAALEMFAETLMQTKVGSGCEQTRRGAEVMRRRVVNAARGMAAKWRSEAAEQSPGPLLDTNTETTTMTFTNLPLAPGSATALALASTHEGAVLALTMFADAAEQEPVGAGSDEYQRGAREMRDFLVGVARKLAAEFCGGATS